MADVEPRHPGDAPGDASDGGPDGGPSPAAGRGGSRALVVVLVVLLVVAIVVDRRGGGGSAPPVARAPAVAATLARTDVRTAAWYCPLAAPTRGTRIDTVLIGNIATAPVDVEVTGVGRRGVRGQRRLTVAPGRTASVDAAALGVRGDGGVVVEPFGPGAVVDRRLDHNRASAVAPCTTALDARWWFPALTTQRGTSSYVALFNPLARTDASVNVTLLTRAGPRHPPALQALEVPRRSRLLLDLERYAARQNLLGVVIDAGTSGRVAAEAVLRNQLGLVIVPPVRQPATTWYYASGTAGASRTIVVESVATVAGDVVVQAVPDRSNRVVPLTLRLEPGAIGTIDAAQLVGASGYSITVNATIPVVVGDLGRERAAGTVAPGPASSLAAALASPRWAVAVSGLTRIATPTVLVLNPQKSPARVTVTIAGQVRTRITIAPGARAVVEYPRRTGGPVVVDADVPVVAERILAGAAGTTRSGAVPAAR